jgi:fused signal recognition particle receptor
LLVAIVVVALVYFFFFRKGAPREADREPASARTRGVSSGAPRGAATGARGEAPGRPGTAAAPAVPASLDDRDVQLEDSRVVPAPRAEAGAKRRSEPPRSLQGADVQTLRRGLARSRDSGGVFGRLKALFGANRQIDAGLAREIEEVLLSSDVGASTTQTLLTRLRDGMDKGELRDPDAVWRALRQEAVQMLSVSVRDNILGDNGSGDGGLDLRHSPTVALFVGVNGAGKTTTIGKLATQLQASGKKCVLAAGDTFRAAAVQQLVIWGRRVGCEVVHGKDGADPASVLFDAINKARELGADVVLADTAGRLHTKANLMNEMQKIARSAGKALNGAPHEIFLVIDSTNGQNALAQAREFKEALDVTGIILTKLDGTAKGGVVLGISDSLRVPVRFVGMGEGPDDLHPFVPQRFVDALLGDEQAS